jgi:hypothetical protein
MSQAKVYGWGTPTEDVELPSGNTVKLRKTNVHMLSKQLSKEQMAHFVTILDADSENPAEITTVEALNLAVAISKLVVVEPALTDEIVSYVPDVDFSFIMNSALGGEWVNTFPTEPGSGEAGADGADVGNVAEPTTKPATRTVSNRSRASAKDKAV